ncbi:hypothetical protein EYZ11_012496 [Aspergillus tanneri]|uniref:Uncharacterized protein n=1 Tax=Aspergillus tanneri TaxID=1220188 RepID=A0A4V3UMN9_9EURO|nr:hypothetical protein EYZ11_012496 [Aspergillus tanneri]
MPSLLGNRVQHGNQKGTLPRDLRNTMTSIPEAVFSDEYRAFHDRASSRVPRHLLPAQDLSELFTLLQRRNMMVFNYFPQAYLLCLMAPPERKKTFAASHIQSLDFKEGDIVNGMYQVCEREKDKVVYAMEGGGKFSGRLSVRYWEEGDEVVYCTETAMWTKATGDNGRTVQMPLEQPAFRFLHELAAWWLLDSGTGYLKGLARGTSADVKEK